MSGLNKGKIIEVLSLKYPNALSITPYKVKPLSDNFDGALLFNLGRIPKKFKNGIIISLQWHRNWPDYLRVVAFGEYKVNIHGSKVCLPTIQEREDARQTLKNMGLWNKRCENLFKVNMGRKDAANR
ncbi:hypothetical protein [Xenorhabdus lircayensis]|uniref:Uncharacterized protein n=1 Tax=Xenorhabdus lircayensis TaxID=2763499 RepID=A0ABS0U005_9GAMM|nr:hypothetical protein [Xenorhabdus lircayensis]MBI6547204.1 hypothetical protein [Xenorhabdus lircayensis]